MIQKRMMQLEERRDISNIVHVDQIALILLVSFHCSLVFPIFLPIILVILILDIWLGVCIYYASNTSLADEAGCSYQMHPPLQRLGQCTAPFLPRLPPPGSAPRWREGGVQGGYAYTHGSVNAERNSQSNHPQLYVFDLANII
jgi:hypothetical protein